jgi:hypothetical protein
MAVGTSQSPRTPTPPTEPTGGSRPYSHPPGRLSAGDAAHPGARLSLKEGPRENPEARRFDLACIQDDFDTLPRHRPPDRPGTTSHLAQATRLALRKTLSEFAADRVCLPCSSAERAFPVTGAGGAVRRVQRPGVENRTILDMINFCPPSTPITARRALKNVLQTRRVYQSRGHRFFCSPGCDGAPSRYRRNLWQICWFPSRSSGAAR